MTIEQFRELIGALHSIEKSIDTLAFVIVVIAIVAAVRKTRDR